MTENELLGEPRVIRAANTVGGGLVERLRSDGAGAYGVVETEVGDNTAESVGAQDDGRRTAGGALRV
jgi:hypothetical protein